MSEKRKFLVFRMMLILLLAGLFADAQKVNTVVLDAGHGGHDTGALGKHSREKDITLSIILMLNNYIQQNLKDVNVILTRNNDEFIELYRRARIANENKADLFISVHCNANPSHVPYGTETYVMGLHKGNANLAVAKAENAAILLEDDYVEQYDGFDPNSAEGNIFFSMMQNAFLDKSLDFAGRVQKQFREKLGYTDRGVKQAGFLVLYKTAMPGVLIEVGFLSNPNDEKVLLSEKGQNQIAYSLFSAFREYKYTVEKRDKSVFAGSDSVMMNNWSNKQPNESSAEHLTLVSESKIQSGSNPDKETAKVIYRVQFASSPVDKPLDSPEFKSMPDIWKYSHEGNYKFTSGKFDSLKQASAFRLEVIGKGFADAFVVPFYKDKRITITEARRLAGN